MNTIPVHVRRLIASLLSACFLLLLAGSGSWNASLASSVSGAPNSENKGTLRHIEAPGLPSCPGGQCFEDVPATSTFFSFINPLYLAGIINGYVCGGSGEPCGPDNRPYYRPAASVTRGQMSKFVDNGRRNIADAIGSSLLITATVARPALVISASLDDAMDVEVGGRNNGISSYCTSAGADCFAFYGSSESGDRPGYFSGGMGVATYSFDSNEPGLAAAGNGTGGVGGQFDSLHSRGADVNTHESSAYSLSVDHPTGGSGAVALNVLGSALIANDLIVGGSKTGYVVDIMQNADAGPLEPGDVVTIAGTSAPVLGTIPVVTVKRASTSYDTGVVGVVDAAVYVPDAGTKALYDSEQRSYKEAQQRRLQVEQAAITGGTRPDYSGISVPKLTITDAEGSIHSLEGVTQVASGSYANVVTLGSYKGVKVDASFAPIHKGDLLVAGPNPGYAMKATDRSLASGASIGKALADLETGTGVIPVMVTLK